MNIITVIKFILWLPLTLSLPTKIVLISNKYVVTDLGSHYTVHWYISSLCIHYFVVTIKQIIILLYG